MILAQLAPIILGGAVGSSLTYTLTWWRERRRMKDAYRAPQREAIGEIVAATHELLVAESTMRDGADALNRNPDQISDAELDAIGRIFARGLYGMDRAFSIGKITVVDASCREAMGAAYNEFILRVHALGSGLDEVTPQTAPDLMPTFLQEFHTRAKDLNVAVADLVEVAQGRISPTQSSWNWVRRKIVKRRLRRNAAVLRDELSGGR